MIDVSNHSVRPYAFKDGTKIIKTKSPTQNMFKKFMAIEGLSEEDAEGMLDIIADMFRMILFNPDKHYVDELPLQIQIAILNEYFEHHSAQLNKTFPSSNTQ